MFHFVNQELKQRLFFFFLIVFLWILSGFIIFVYADSVSELKENINKKNQELKFVNDQIRNVQKNIETTQNQSRTLQKELQKIDQNINQLNLSIRSSEILLEKLQLEINVLQYDIKETENDILQKKQNITQILQQIYKQSDENFLTIVLRNKTLAQSIFDLQGLYDLNVALNRAVVELNNAKQRLAQQLEDTSQKKAKVSAENENLKNKKIILNDTKEDKQNILRQVKNQEQLYQQSLIELKKRQAELASEIEKIEAELRAKINVSSLPGKRPGILGIPISRGNLTQDYGATNFARYAYAGKWHNGVDFGAPIGTPVLAAEKGEVIAVGNQDIYCPKVGYGKYIVIKHNNNLTTLYGHLSLQIVQVGNIVQRGQIIGYVGRTGYATGPHLHFTVYFSPTFEMKSSRSCYLTPVGGDLNPLDYLDLKELNNI
jgi:murein DD-endopeptidase MepM/ murein hydrolase activator NlpD